MIGIICPGCDKQRPTTYPCCNPLCGGMRGTGCHHCHHPSYFVANIGKRWRRARQRDGFLPIEPVGLWMLWALALEIDERRATRTGERVCRACGGRGDGRIWTLTTASIVRRRWNHAEPCACDGPTRPVTVSLHGVVEAMSTRPPRGAFTYRPVSIPDRWLVDLDAMEAAGWGDLVLPSTKLDHAARCKWWDENGDRLDTPAERDANGSGPMPHHPDRHGPHVTPAWQSRWWRAWSDWARAGREPDPEELALDLRQLLPALEAREEAKAEALAKRRTIFMSNAWAGEDWLDRVQMGGIQVRDPQRITLRARCETLAAGIDPDALWSAAEELSRTTAANFEDALEGIAASCRATGLKATMGRALLPALENIASAVAEIVADIADDHETEARDLRARVDRLEDPAPPRSRPIGRRLRRKLE